MLPEMGSPQMIGIVFGCTVFAATLVSVGLLLVFGGSFERMKLEAESGPQPVSLDHKLFPALYCATLVLCHARLVPCSGCTMLVCNILACNMLVCNMLVCRTRVVLRSCVTLVLCHARLVQYPWCATLVLCHARV